MLEGMQQSGSLGEREMMWVFCAWKVDSPPAKVHPAPSDHRTGLEEACCDCFEVFLGSCLEVPGPCVQIE